MARTTNSQPISVGPSDVPGAKRRWVRFLGGVTVILLFAFGVIPGLQRLGPVRRFRDAIGRRGIDATALFYTESEVSCEAEASIRNAIRYSVRHDDCPAGAP